jgi:cytochrome c oxidase cbb3-type subunit III
MRPRMLTGIATLALAAALAGCDRAPGDAKVEEYTPPNRVTDFHALYATNCQACHGANGQSGPATDLGNPEYQTLVDDATLKKWISNGMPGTEMPAFAQSAGGMLTDAQIDAIVAGMRSDWRKGDAFSGMTPPPYAQPEAAGNAAHGQQVYQARCASCHQNPAREQPTSPVYLSLVSDQALRTIMVAGRPDIHQPDWQHDTPDGSAGAPLTAEDVTDLVTYLHTLRNPGAVSAAPTTPAQQ